MNFSKRTIEMINRAQGSAICRGAGIGKTEVANFGAGLAATKWRIARPDPDY
jgi:hypothetical protein